MTLSETDHILLPGPFRRLRDIIRPVTNRLFTADKFMSNHFDGKYEAEIKYRLADHSAFLSQLSTMHAEPFVVNNEETDWFFDTPQTHLADGNVSMSVRTMTPSGIKLWIVKGPAASECKAINIDDHEHVRNMLLTLGYRCTMTLTKTRSVWFLGDIHITLDHINGAGWFAEFAIMTHDETKLAEYRERLREKAAEFGLTDDMIEKQSYKQLVSAMQKNSCNAE